MLMPRIPYQPQQQQLTNGFRPEMQHQHINQLLITAAAGTGIVGDVDALLTPVPVQPPAKLPTVRPEPGRERNLWRTNEIMEVLTIMQEINAIEMLNVKTVKSELVFRKVEKIMRSRGFTKKSSVQIWTKWKFLKSTYTTSRRNGIIPKMIPQTIYEELHNMLKNAKNNNNNNNNNTNSSAHSTTSGGDCGNSITSLDDGDTHSNGAITNGKGSAGGSQFIISGVEGGYEGSKSSFDDIGVGVSLGDESEEENGLAHPIFGFRLGVVKQEPADTGYETPTLTDTNTKDTTDNIQFQTEIKQEVNDQSQPTPESAEATPQPPPSHPRLEEALQQQPKRQSAPEVMILNRRAPAKYVGPTADTTPTPTNMHSPVIPNATSTPNILSPVAVAPPQAPSRPDSANTPGSSTIPPLRIAPFAKVPPSELLTPISATDLSPPPLALNPSTTCALRLNSAYAGGPTNAKSGSGSPLTIGAHQRNKVLPRAISRQMQTTNAAATSRPPLLEPYSQRDEVLVPDMDVQAAPHEYRAAQPFYGFPDGPSTSQHAQHQQYQQQMEAQKRRLRASQMMSTMPPKRMARQFDHTTTNRLTPRQAALEFGGHEAYVDGDCISEEENHFVRTTYQMATPVSQRADQTARDNNERQWEQDREWERERERERQREWERERDQTHAKVMQEMALSLRKMQREMINEFFKRQMKLAREEHEFQMRQDELLMQAFQEQAMQFQRMGKELMGSAVKLEKRKKKLERQARKQMLDNEIKQVQKMQSLYGEKKPSESKKVLHNGVGCGKVAVQQKNKANAAEKNDISDIHLLMSNVKVQLDLSESSDEDDNVNQNGNGDVHERKTNGPNPIEYADVGEYTQDTNDVDMEEESMAAIENGEKEQQGQQNNGGWEGSDDDDDEDGDDDGDRDEGTSMPITGH